MLGHTSTVHCDLWGLQKLIGYGVDAYACLMDLAIYCACEV